MIKKAPILVVSVAIAVICACGSSSDSSSSSENKYSYCQTAEEAEGGYSLVLCREYLNLSKSDKEKAIAQCDESDTGDWQDEQQCPDSQERRGGCTAEEEGLDVVMWFYADYTADEAETACTSTYEGDWATAFSFKMASGQ